MRKELNLEVQRAVKCVYHLKFRGGVTIISGESGVGKTLLYNTLNERPDTLCFNHTFYKVKNTIPESIIKNANANTIVVLDKLDMIMTDALNDFIMQNNTKIQFILYGRQRYACVQTVDWICKLVRRQYENGVCEFRLAYKLNDLEDLQWMQEWGLY